MADTSTDGGLSNIGPDPLSYASNGDCRHEENSPSREHPQQTRDPRWHWTHDDPSSNSQEPQDHSDGGSSSDIYTGKSVHDNGDDIIGVSGPSFSNKQLTENGMDITDYTSNTPPCDLMETSGHVRLGREGSADGGSVSPIADDNNSNTTNPNPSDTVVSIDHDTLCKKGKMTSMSKSYTRDTSSSNESTPRRSASASASRAKSNPPAPSKAMVTSVDMSMLDMKTSWDGTVKAGMLADPAKIAKEREKEERVRQARERLEEERKKKLEEMKEQMRQAQENRERQLEMRRQKIEDLRRRDSERRAAVEERRKMKEEIERLRKESILQKAEERVARYEAWRAGGRKGNLMGGGGVTPRHLSVSTSVLYNKRHSEFSSSSTLSSANRPESALDRSKGRLSRKKDKSATKDGSSSAKGKEKKEEAEDEKDGGSTTSKKGRASLSFFDRLATPKFQRNQDDHKDTPRKEASPIMRLSPRKAYSTTNLSTMKKKSASFREKTKENTSSPRMVARRDTSASSPRTRSSLTGSTGSPSTKPSTSASPRVTPPPHSSARAASPQVNPSSSQTAPSITVTTAHGGSAAPGSEDGTAAPRAMGVNQGISEEEYKAKIAEKRRQAREKAEREAEEERRKQEEERLAEEERQMQEEEEQRRLEVETIRLAEEARKAEEERLQKAIEAEEKRKKEEAERLEQEKKAKEEADRKAKEEAERIEREKQEKAKKEEEERMQRKKKLEMIMKRVKTDPAQDNNSTGSNSSLKMESSPFKSSAGSSPNRSALTSPDVQEMPPFGAPPATQDQDHSSGSEDGDHKQQKVDSGVTSSSSDSLDNDKSSLSSQQVLTPVVRSASSGDIIDSTDDNSAKVRLENGNSLGSLNISVNSSTPTNSADGSNNSESTTSSSSEVKSRFKSPLLQQLVENKGSSANSSGTPKFKSPLLQNLLGKTKVGARMGLSASMGDLNLNKDNNSATADSSSGADAASTSPTSSVSPASSSKEISKAGQDEDKDVDESSTAQLPPNTAVSESSSAESFSPDHDAMTNGVDDDHESDIMTKLPDVCPPDSGSKMMDSALGASIDPSANLFVMSNGHGGDGQQHVMEDSSIDLHSPADEDKPLGAATTSSQSGQSSSQEETEEEEEEEEKGSGRFEEYIDLLEGSTHSKSASVTPIMAFEDNSLRTSDIGESLS